MAINCVLIRWNEPEKTTFNIINQNAFISNPVVIGLDPDLEYLVKRTPYTEPEYDSQLVRLVTTEQFVDEEDIEFPPLRKFVTTYSLLDRTIEEKKISVDDNKNVANNSVFPIHKQMELVTTALALNIKLTQGGTITAPQQVILDKIMAKGARIYNNHVVGIAKKADIDNGLPVNLTSDFEIIDPEDEE